MSERATNCGAAPVLLPLLSGVAGESDEKTNRKRGSREKGGVGGGGLTQHLVKKNIERRESAN